MNMTITLQFEFTDGTTKQYPFHLGTDLELARRITEEKLAHMDFGYFAPGKTVRSAGLLQAHKLVDCHIYGQWQTPFETDSVQ